MICGGRGTDAIGASWRSVAQLPFRGNIHGHIFSGHIRNQKISTLIISSDSSGIFVDSRGESCRAEGAFFFSELLFVAPKALFQNSGSRPAARRGREGYHRPLVFWLSRPVCVVCLSVCLSSRKSSFSDIWGAFGILPAIPQKKYVCK